MSEPDHDHEDDAVKKKDAPADERPDEAKRRERPDAIPPDDGNEEQVQGYTDLDREREAELPPDKREQP